MGGEAKDDGWNGTIRFQHSKSSVYLFERNMDVGSGNAHFSVDKIERTRISIQRKLLDKAQKNAALLTTDELAKVDLD